MIYHVRSKYTAVGKWLIVWIKVVLIITSANKIGRKEIVIFFFCYILTVFFEMLLVTDIIPSASAAYPVSLFLKLIIKFY
jgi:hypothetical protein